MQQLQYINFHYRPNWKKKLKNWEKKTKLSYIYIQRTLGLAYFPHFKSKTLFLKNLTDIHNSTWARNTMLISQKKLKGQFQENFWTEGRADLIHMTLNWE